MRGVRGSAVAEKETSGETPKRGRPPVKRYEKIAGWKIIPFTHKDDLPVGKMDTKGNVVEQGESRFFLTGERLHGYKLVRAYWAKGPKQSLVCTLKPAKKNARGKRDKELVEKLFSLGVPIREGIN